MDGQHLHIIDRRLSDSIVTITDRTSFDSKLVHRGVELKPSFVSGITVRSEGMIIYIV